MKIVPIHNFGELAAGFWNIRANIDGDTGIFDLISEKLLPPGSVESDETHPVLKRLHDKSSLVVEGATLLRVEFSWLLAVAVDFDIDVDLFGDLWQNWQEMAPQMPGCAAFYPFVEIKESPWKARLPEWRARDNPDVRHFRMLSALVSFDVLGELASGAWLNNTNEWT